MLIKDRIADSMFQQIQLRPDEYSVIATPNLNGDYLSDAAAALTGGIGLAAGANIGDQAAMFEATHGTAPKYTGKNMANPGAVLLSGVLMLEHMGWDEAAELVNKAVEATFAESEEIAKKGPGGKLHVTYDIARQFAGYGAEAGASSSRVRRPHHRAHWKVRHVSVILSAAKNLRKSSRRSFAALRMTVFVLSYSQHESMAHYVESVLAHNLDLASHGRVMGFFLDVLGFVRSARIWIRTVTC